MSDNTILISFGVLIFWFGMAPVAWLFLCRYPFWDELGWIVVLIVGFCVGMVSNFLVFFCGVLFFGANHFVLMLFDLILFFVVWLVFGKLISGRWDGVSNQVRRLSGGVSGGFTGWKLFPISISFLFFFLILGKFYSEMEKYIPGVFDSWDAVVSWNRWALEWFFGDVPAYTMGYPQLLPTALAQIYISYGSILVQPVARLFLLIFGMLPLLCFFDGFLRWRSDRFVWGGIFWLACMTWIFPDLVNSGYADVPGACFVAITGYLLLLGVTGVIAMSSSLYLAAFSAAAAVVTKQPAGLAWLIWMAVACKTWISQPLMRNEILKASCLFLVISAPWYCYVLFQMYSGKDVSNIIYLVQGIHGDRGWMDRLIYAVKGPFANILAGNGYLWEISIALAVLFVSSCWNVWGRWLVGGVVVPFFLLWALLFSYDARNLLPMLGVVCLVLGIGMSEIVNGLCRIFKTRARGVISLNGLGLRVSSYFLVWTPLLAFVGLVGLVFGGGSNTASLEQLQMKLQYESGSETLNRRLLAYASNPGFDGLVITTYLPMITIEALGRNTPPLTKNPNLGSKTMTALIAGHPLCDALDVNSERMKGVRYLLLHKNIFPQVVDRALADGSLRLELEVDAIRLMRMNCH